MPGTLFVVATPIGNLEDITLRAVRALKEADLIACEDTRHALKLLNHLGIRKEMISFHEPRVRERLPILMDRLRRGKNIALISDAGTPAISDPGFRLAREAVKEGIRVIPVPGPSAVTAALCAGGLPTHRFLFLGFPPPKKEISRRYSSTNWLAVDTDRSGHGGVSFSLCADVCLPGISVYRYTGILAWKPTIGPDSRRTAGGSRIQWASGCGASSNKPGSHP